MFDNAPATRVPRHAEGTYDHKHVDRIAGIQNCAAYGPGIVDLAHQPDEWCSIDDLVNATKVLALAMLELTRSAAPASARGAHPPQII